MRSLIHTSLITVLISVITIISSKIISLLFHGAYSWNRVIWILGLFVVFSERKVVIIICSDRGTVTQDEEDALTNQISLLLCAKGVVLWSRGNQTVPRQTQNPRPPKRFFDRSQSVPDHGTGKRSMALNEARPIDPRKFTLLLKTRLHRGKISYQEEDIEQRLEGWTAPEYITDDLMKKNQSTVDADLQIYQENCTNNYHVVVHDRKDSKTGNKIVNSVKYAIDAFGEWCLAQTESNDSLYYTL